MADDSASLMQRVEALEQISHARVVERVGQIEQRVSRIESARETEEPHVATKADISRLETLVVETRSGLQEQIGETRSGLQEQIGETRSSLQEQIGETRSSLQEQISETRSGLQEQIGETRSGLQEQIGETRSGLQEQISDSNATMEKRLRELIMWMVGTAIALTAVIIAAAAFIVSRLT